MVCSDSINGTLCDIMAESGLGIAKFFSTTSPAFLTLSIVIASSLVFMAIIMILLGFMKKVRQF